LGLCEFSQVELSAVFHQTIRVDDAEEPQCIAVLWPDRVAVRIGKMAQAHTKNFPALLHIMMMECGDQVPDGVTHGREERAEIPGGDSGSLKNGADVIRNERSIIPAGIFSWR